MFPAQILSTQFDAGSVMPKWNGSHRQIGDRRHSSTWDGVRAADRQSQRCARVSDVLAVRIRKCLHLSERPVSTSIV